MKRFVYLCFVLCFVVACSPAAKDDASSEEVETIEEVPSDLPIALDTFDHSITTQSKKVKISTNYGDMIVLLYNETPLHRDNFLKLVQSGFYDDLLFHRVMNDFMIQGGDPKSKGAPVGMQLGKGGPGYTIPAEINPRFFHKKGALSAARKPDHMNPNKESSGSQFFIVQGRKWEDENIPSKVTAVAREYYKTEGGCPPWDGDYTVFGEVIEGLEVIDKIAIVKTDPNNRPLKDIKMKVTILE